MNPVQPEVEVSRPSTDSRRAELCRVFIAFARYILFIVVLASALLFMLDCWLFVFDRPWFLETSVTIDKSIFNGTLTITYPGNMREVTLAIAAWSCLYCAWWISSDTEQ